MVYTTSEEHQKHIQGGYFQKGCDECAKFVGHAVMKGHLKLEGVKYEKNKKKDA